MESDWSEFPLDEIASKPQYGYTGNAIAEKIGPRYIRITDLTDTGEVLSKNKVFIKMTPEELKKFKLEKGDILIARTGTVGRAAIWDKEEDAVFASYLVRFKIDPKKAIPKFVFYFLKSADFSNYVQKEKIGVTQIYLNGKKMGKFKLKLPPLPTQQKIVARLDAFFEKYEGMKEAYEISKQQKENVFRAYVKKLENQTAEKITLNKASEIIMGQSPPGNTYNKKGNGLPLINGPTEFGKVHPKAIQYTTKPTKLCKKGDILFCVRGSTTGKMNLADREYCLGRGVAAIRVTEDLQEIVYAFLENLTSEVLRRSKGTTFPNIKSNELKSLKLPLSPPDQNQIISKEIKTLKEKISLISSEKSKILTSLNLLPKSILAKAFSGELVK